MQITSKSDKLFLSYGKFDKMPK